MAIYLTEAHRINSEKAIAALNRQGKIDVQKAVEKMERMHEELRKSEEEKNSPPNHHHQSE